jgi:hypothetical protein
MNAILLLILRVIPVLEQWYVRWQFEMQFLPLLHSILRVILEQEKQVKGRQCYLNETTRRSETLERGHARGSRAIFSKIVQKRTAELERQDSQVDRVSMKK